MLKVTFKKVVSYDLMILLLTQIQATVSAEAKSIPLTEEAKRLSQAAKRVIPAVVMIKTERVVKVRVFPPGRIPDDLKKYFPKEGEDSSKAIEWRECAIGTGMIIDPQGFILTCEALAIDSGKTEVILSDGSKYVAQVKGKDSRAGVAILKIPAKKLPVVRLGDSDKLELGQLVMAIGTAKNLPGTVCVGVISGLHRSGLGTFLYEDFIQTDIPVAEGFAGGPLINLDGEVIGLIAFATTGKGDHGMYPLFSFAIPINFVKKIIPTLKADKSVEYGWLGIYSENISEEIAKQYHIAEAKGVLVADVVKGSPADKVGIKIGDIIVEYNGEVVRDSQDLILKVINTEIGRKVSLKIIRRGIEQSLSVEIAKRPE